MPPTVRTTMLLLAATGALAFACSQSSTTGTAASAASDEDAGGTADGGAGVGEAGAANVPGDLATRITDLNACQSRLQETRRTFPVQDIQAEAEGGAILYAFYNIDSQGLNSPFTVKTQGATD